MSPELCDGVMLVLGTAIALSGMVLVSSAPTLPTKTCHRETSPVVSGRVEYSLGSSAGRFVFIIVVLGLDRSSFGSGQSASRPDSNCHDDSPNVPLVPPRSALIEAAARVASNRGLRILGLPLRGWFWRSQAPRPRTRPSAGYPLARARDATGGCCKRNMARRRRKT